MSDRIKQKLAAGIRNRADCEVTVNVEVTMKLVFSISLDPGEDLIGEKLGNVLFENAVHYLKTVAELDSDNGPKNLDDFTVINAYRDDQGPPPVEVQVVPDDRESAFRAQLSTDDDKIYSQHWSKEDSIAANAQGWDIFYASGSSDGPWQLQRIDAPEDGSDPKFEGDKDAAEFVRKQAAAGDELAKRAIACLVALKSQDIQKFNLTQS